MVAVYQKNPPHSNTRSREGVESGVAGEYESFKMRWDDPQNLLAEVDNDLENKDIDHGLGF